jgi:hypothetical protein
MTDDLSHEIIAAQMADWRAEVARLRQRLRHHAARASAALDTLTSLTDRIDAFGDASLIPEVRDRMWTEITAQLDAIHDSLAVLHRGPT